MKKATVLMAVTAAVGLLALTAGFAQAETCYRLTPFSDVLRLNVDILEGATGSQHVLVYGNWITTSYSIPVVGARELNRGSTSVRRLSLHGTNNTTSFGGNRICAIDGIPGAAWTLTCVGGPGVRFINSGTALTSISCTGLAPSTAFEDGGGEAGD